MHQSCKEQAKQMFTAVADSLDYVGVLTLEFFDVDGTLLVNEIAPRVHNSVTGHSKVRKLVGLKTICAPCAACR